MVILPPLTLPRLSLAPPGEREEPTALFGRVFERGKCMSSGALKFGGAAKRWRVAALGTSQLLNTANLTVRKIDFGRYQERSCERQRHFLHRHVPTRADQSSTGDEFRLGRKPFGHSDVGATKRAISRSTGRLRNNADIRRSRHAQGSIVSEPKDHGPAAEVSKRWSNAERQVRCSGPSRKAREATT